MIYYSQHNNIIQERSVCHMSSRKTVLIVFAALFAILTLVFYFSSIKELDRNTASYLGVSAVANVQGTVFTGACAVCS